jgi:hypothetical protein
VLVHAACVILAFRWRSGARGLEDAADVQDHVVDLADLEDVAAAGDDVADVQIVAFVREISDRLAVLVDELVMEDLRLHVSHSTAAG